MSDDIFDATDENLITDAACAHALMQAMTALNGEGWSRKRNPVAEIRDRADSIMAGRGFDSWEVE